MLVFLELCRHQSNDFGILGGNVLCLSRIGQHVKQAGVFGGAHKARLPAAIRTRARPSALDLDKIEQKEVPPAQSNAKKAPKVAPPTDSKGSAPLVLELAGKVGRRGAEVRQAEEGRPEEGRDDGAGDKGGLGRGVCQLALPQAHGRGAHQGNAPCRFDVYVCVRARARVCAAAKT